MPRPKKSYLIVACTKCNRFLLASSESGSRMCPYCGKNVRVENARVLGRADSPKEARKMLQEAKTRERSLKPDVLQTGR